MSISNINQNQHYKSAASFTPLNTSGAAHTQSKVGAKALQHSYSIEFEKSRNIIQSDSSDAESIKAATEKLCFLARAKYAPAEYFLGTVFMGGKTDEAQKEGIRLIQRAANRGYAPAQSDVGSLYLHGLFGKTQSVIQARKWFTLSANQGCAEGQNNLGILYLGENEIKRDYFKAANLFKSAALKGNLFAQFQLSMMYEYGMGVAIDRKASFYWIKKAALGGYIPAQLNMLGKIVSTNSTEFDGEPDVELVRKYEMMN